MCISKKKDRDARKRKKHNPQNMSIRELYVYCMLFGTTTTTSTMRVSAPVCKISLRPVGQL